MKTTRTNDYFVVTRVHAEDLVAIGFDGYQLDDAMMRHIARKLGDNYVENLFWDHLAVLAKDLEVPRL